MTIYSQIRLFLVALVAFYTHSTIYAVSMVYNFRLAQITKHFQLDRQKDTQDEQESSIKLVGLAFEQARKKRDETSQNYLGGLGSFIYNYDYFYSRVDGAFAYVTQRIDHVTTYKGTQTDDILVSLGYNFLHTDQDLVTLTGLAGFPTHRIVRLLHPDFGYGQFAAGCQIDGSHALSLDYKTIFMYGVRYVYYIPGTALDPEGIKHEFTPGSTGDIFLANKHRLAKKHGIEYGYTAKFRFGATIFPDFDDIIKRSNFIRSNFYIVYKYDFAINDIKSRFLLNFSYGFDHIPKETGNKYIITLWASLNTTF